MYELLRDHKNCMNYCEIIKYDLRIYSISNKYSNYNNTFNMAMQKYYWTQHNKYTKKYGENTIVLCQVGSFHETYATDTKGPDLDKLSMITNLIKTKKNKKIKTVNDKNPYLLGVTSIAKQKYIKILIENGYTVVIIDQVTDPPNIRREVTGIFSAGTYIDNSFTPDSNYIVCIYIENEQQMSGNFLTCAGMSGIDLTTGENTIHYAHSKIDDDKYALDEACRFINSYNPKEILIYKKSNKCEPETIFNKDFIITYLELDNKNYKYFDRINKELYKMNYQNQFLAKTFGGKTTGMLSPLEYLDLERTPYAAMSYILVLNYAYQHNNDIIKNLYKPIIFENNRHLILGNNAVFQLNVLDDTSVDKINRKYKSLFDVVNKTSTAIGRRFLKSALTSPLTSTKLLRLRYECIDELLKDDKFMKIEKQLRGIIDLERFYRKLSLSKLHPFEFADLVDTYDNVHNLIKYVNKLSYCRKILPENKDIKMMRKFWCECNKTFDLNELKKYSLDSIENSFFKKGIDEDIDKLQEEIIDNIEFMQNICTVLSDHITDVGRAKKAQDNLLVLESDKNGYYLTCTHTRAKILKQTIEEYESIKITEDYFLNTSDIIFKEIAVGKNNKKTVGKITFPNLNKDDPEFANRVCNTLKSFIDSRKVHLKKNNRDGYYLQLTKLRAKSLKTNLKNIKSLKITKTYSLDPKNLIFKDLPQKKGNEMKGNTKIFFDDLREKSDSIIDLQNEIKDLILEKYKTYLQSYWSKYSVCFQQTVKFIALIDFVKSGAKIAKMYNYTKPVIEKRDNGFIRCSSLRHPIIERILVDYEYVPHDFRIGHDELCQENETPLNGMLIYGINSAGKSSCMKAVGLSIILAQCGLYVPAIKFTYSPYNSLFARISGNDNIFKGLSSFGLEMTELRAILKRSGPKTLVLGDEVCRGTEHVSGNSIVAGTIITLAKTGSTFLFATHLHEIAKMDKIRALDNVKSFHLTVEYDKEKDKLVFDRKLKEGTGEPIYGVKVAKYIIHDNEFIKLVEELKNEFLGLPNTILNTKKSKYNALLYVNECKICGKKITEEQLDTHHINFQKDCIDGFVKTKPHLRKNCKANLIVLCKPCHNKVHDGKLSIKGYIKTSQGRKLKTQKTKKRTKCNISPRKTRNITSKT